MAHASAMGESYTNVTTLKTQVILSHNGIFQCALQSRQRFSLWSLDPLCRNKGDTKGDRSLFFVVSVSFW